MRVEWAVEGDQLRCVMSAPTSGWVRVGFNTVRAQHLANMVVGWVDAEGVHVEDRFATDPPYIEPDLQLGGSVDAVALGPRAGECAAELGRFGVRRLYHVDDAALEFYAPEAYAACLAESRG